MQIGDLVKHRVNDMIGIIVRLPRVAAKDLRIVRWNNGMQFTEKVNNLVALC